MNKLIFLILCMIFIFSCTKETVDMRRINRLDSRLKVYVLDYNQKYIRYTTLGPSTGFYESESSLERVNTSCPSPGTCTYNETFSSILKGNDGYEYFRVVVKGGNDTPIIYIKHNRTGLMAKLYLKKDYSDYDSLLSSQNASFEYRKEYYLQGKKYTDLAFIYMSRPPYYLYFYYSKEYGVIELKSTTDQFELNP